MGSSGSKLSKEEIVELKKATEFDKSELNSGYGDFMRRYPSGKMTEQEFIDSYIKILSEFHPSANPTTYYRIIFKAYDPKEKGVLSFGEFVRGISIPITGSETKKAEWSFKIYDQNRTGKLTYDDFLVIQTEIYKMFGSQFNMPDDEKTAELRCQKIFRALGKEWKGDTINLNEFKELVKKDYWLAMLDSQVDSMEERAV